MTGIVRRIDDLGRIVIPKEIRNNLRIHDGENLEIFVRDDEIILKKHMVMNKIFNYAQNFTDAIYSFIKKNVIITNVDKVIAASGEIKKQYIDKELSEELINSMKRRESILENHTKELKIADISIECTYILNTIIVNGDAVGLLIIMSTDEKIGDIDYKIAKIVSSFLERELSV